MSLCDDTKLNRSMLLGARIRFSPTGATIRNQAVEVIIEQALASSPLTEGMTESQLQQIVTLSGDSPILRVSDVSRGLEALVKTNSVIKFNENQEVKYRLPEKAQNEITQALISADDMWTEVVNDLFSPTKKTLPVYKTAFIQVLCIVFSSLSESNIRIILRQKGGLDGTDSDLLNQSIFQVIQQYSIDDKRNFQYGVRRFFQEPDSKFNSLKWNMAQNYYIVKALGIDSTADILSPSVFKDAVMYCDTNVLIGGLTPIVKYNNSVKELAKACKDIGINLSAAHITLKELENVLGHHAELLDKNLNQIPKETIPKVHDFLLEAFNYERLTNPNVTIDDIVSRFKNPLDKLKSISIINEVDDSWFDNAVKEDATIHIAASLSKLYNEMRHKKKSKGAALHDAVLLRWVEKENDEGTKSWIITHDLTLADWSTMQDKDNYKVVTLDALLQWMTPISLQSANEDTLASIFSTAISFRLLPVENFIKLRDFQVFNEMGIETNQLPSEDVEACIREIRKSGAALDPSKAVDREKIGRIIQGFFADPGTKFKQTIEELQGQTERLSKDLQLERENRQIAEDKVDKISERADRLQSQVEEKDKELEKANGRIDALDIKFQSLVSAADAKEEKDKRIAEIKKLKNSTIVIIVLSISLWVVLELVLFSITFQYLDGANTVQKVVSGLALLCIPAGLLIPIVRFFLGKKRTELLLNWNDPNE